MSQKILSVHGGHNASAAVVYMDGSKLRCLCIESERIDRIKMSCGCKRYSGDDFSPANKSQWIRTQKSDLTMLIEHLLKEAGLGIRDIDKIVLSQNTETERLPTSLSGIPTVYVPHHKSHAALAYYTSDFDEALVVVCDGSGEKTKIGYEIQTAWSCYGNRMHLVHSTYQKSIYNMGIGNAYELYTYWLGYGYNGCGTTMALAAFCQENPMPAGRIFNFGKNGDVFLNTELVDIPAHVDRLGYHKEGTAAYNQAHEDMMRSVDLPSGYRLRIPNEPSLQTNFIRMAADIQNATEKAILYYVDNVAKKNPGHRHLCMGGGTFLNCKINSMLRGFPWVDDIHVPTAPGDGGLALGAALACYFENNERCPVDNTAYIGTQVHKVSLSSSDIVYSKVPINIYSETARMLSEGKIVGWCQGRAEFGPRALGHRSLLADPRSNDIPNRINQILKHREPFRPFAPVVLKEKYGDFFELPMPIPYMLETRRILRDKVDLIPAVCHVDYSARVQVVSEENCPELHRLIGEFDQLTGVPVLVNTSLNRNGEPIVDTGDDALVLLRKGMLDALVIEDTIYLRK